MDEIALLLNKDDFLKEIKEYITVYEYQSLNVLAIANQLKMRAKATGVKDLKKTALPWYSYFWIEFYNNSK